MNRLKSLSLATLFSFMIVGYAHTQTWQYFNDTNKDVITTFLDIDNKGDIYNLTYNKLSSVNDPIKLNKHSGLDGMVIIFWIHY